MLPAHAGMILGKFQRMFFVSDVTRTRGDDPKALSEKANDVECYPHTRG